MNAVAKRVLEEFDSLPTSEQQIVASEILRRTATADHEPLDDDQLVQQAEELFQILDEAEANDGKDSATR